jgi:hypothetical protein
LLDRDAPPTRAAVVPPPPSPYVPLTAVMGILLARRSIDDDVAEKRDLMCHDDAKVSQ